MAGCGQIKIVSIIPAPIYPLSGLALYSLRVIQYEERTLKIKYGVLSLLLVVFGVGLNKTMLNKNTTWFDEYNAHGDSDKAMRALKQSEPELTIKYVKTDGWRGYYEAKAKRGTGWRKVEEIDGEKLAGWVTGEWDDAPEGTRGSELESLLNKLDAKEAKIVFLPTSNVFSTAYDIFVR